MKYESCRRTQADDEFLLVRLQVFCLTVGTLAFASVRKQRVLSANAFDKRRSSVVSGGNSESTISIGRSVPKASRSNISTIELMATNGVRNQETVPLTDNDSMDVV